MSLRSVCAALLLAASPLVSAQSADQEIVSVVDSPDPVTPGANVTYTVTARNNGPNAAANGGINFNWDGPYNFVSASGPAGFTCVVGFGATCSTPSFASGATAVFTIVLQLDPSRANFPDGSSNFNVTTSGTTADPVGGNDARSIATGWDSPQIDLAMSVADSPDPVSPGGDITYTATLTQAGPDTASNVNFNVYHAQGLKFRSLSAPTGWGCVPPGLNGTPIFSCSRATLAPGTSVFTVVLRANSDTLGVNDGNVTVLFQATGTGNETNDANNSQNIVTAYTTPDADLALSVTDNPDPVAPDGSITYTVNATNNGPDTATNASFSVYNAQGLRFQSLSSPAGFQCNPPSPNGAIIFSCTIPSFASGANATFTVVARAPLSVIGPSDTTIQTVFQFYSQIKDPVDANNTETESTAYVGPDADLSITVADAPDPVIAGNDITYSATVTNNGPDSAANAQVSVYNNGSLRFQSVAAASPFTCTPPGPNAAPIFSCTAPALATGASATLTLVAKTDEALVGINGGTVQTSFSTASQATDPVNDNNLRNVETTVLSDRLLSDGFE